MSQFGDGTNRQAIYDALRDAQSDCGMTDQQLVREALLALAAIAADEKP